MKRSSALNVIAALFLLISWVGPTATAEELTTRQEARAELSEPMPDVLWEDLFLPAPVFVAADTLSTPEGIDLSIFPPGLAAGVEGTLAIKPKRGCIRLDSPGELRDEPPRDWSDLRSAMVNSDHIIVGQVTGLRPGFVLGRGGTLVRFQVLEQIKGNVIWVSRFFVVPLGQMRVGQKQLCMSNEAWSPLPRVGDRLVLLYDADWNNERSQVLLGVTAPHVIVLPHDDQQAHLPRFFRQGEKRAESSAEELIAEIREYAEAVQ